MNEARVGMLVIESGVGLTKSDKMIYAIYLSEISHLFKIGIASNDLMDHNFPCFLWKLLHQKSQAARKHLDIPIITGGLHQHRLPICVMQGCLCVGMYALGGSGCGIVKIVACHVTMAFLRHRKSSTYYDQTPNLLEKHIFIIYRSKIYVCRTSRLEHPKSSPEAN